MPILFFLIAAAVLAVPTMLIWACLLATALVPACKGYGISKAGGRHGAVFGAASCSIILVCTHLAEISGQVMPVAACMVSIDVLFGTAIGALAGLLFGWAAAWMIRRRIRKRAIPSPNDAPEEPGPDR
jgi:hypothetical protein